MVNRTTQFLNHIIRNLNTIFLFLNPDIKGSFSFFRFFSLTGCIPWIALCDPSDLLDPSSSGFMSTSKSPAGAGCGGGGGGGKGGNGGKLCVDVVDVE